MKKWIVASVFLISLGKAGRAASSEMGLLRSHEGEASFYRGLTLKIRKTGAFTTHQPDGHDMHYKYGFDWANQFMRSPK